MPTIKWFKLYNEKTIEVDRNNFFSSLLSCHPIFTQQKFTVVKNSFWQKLTHCFFCCCCSRVGNLYWVPASFKILPFGGFTFANTSTRGQIKTSTWLFTSMIPHSPHIHHLSNLSSHNERNRTEQNGARRVSSVWRTHWRSMNFTSTIQWAMNFNFAHIERLVLWVQCKNSP